MTTAMPTTYIDTRPAMPVSDESFWDRAARKRDEFAALIRDSFRAAGYDAWVQISKPGEYPLFVFVNSWVPLGETDVAATFDRGSLKITIDVEPFLEHPFTYRAELAANGRQLAETRWSMSGKDVADCVRYLLEGNAKPQYFEAQTPWFLALFGLNFDEKNELIAEARPNHFTGPSVFGWLGGVAVAFGGFAFIDSGGESGPMFFLGLAGAIALVGALYVSGKRTDVDAIAKQSSRAPRREFRFDSWHVSVPGAGRSFEEFRERLQQAVSDIDPEIEVSEEVHQNVTPRGIEERSRLVLLRGQTTLHLHVYPFGDDAFVGWETYLNWQRWGLSNPVASTVRDDGKRVTYRTLEVAGYVPNAFDLIDAELLAEAIHRIVVEEIKHWLEEREIEADLDFQIIRADRNSALTQGKQD